MRSHPTRVRGLKHRTTAGQRRRYLVAPHAGAWIETDACHDAPPIGQVAPHAGAWIETRLPEPGSCRACLSHPTRVRGLKPNAKVFATYVDESHPTRVRGLKHELHERGLRGGEVAPHAGAWIETRLMAHKRHPRPVAPHAGAWIETRPATLPAYRSSPRSHPTRVRGLKLLYHFLFRGMSRRTPRGCVD